MPLSSSHIGPRKNKQNPFVIFGVNFWGRNKYGNEILWLCSLQSSDELSGPFCLETPHFHLRCPQIVPHCSCECSFEVCHSHSFSVPEICNFSVVFPLYRWGGQKKNLCSFSAMLVDLACRGCSLTLQGKMKSRPSTKYLGKLRLQLHEDAVRPVQRAMHLAHSGRYKP